jgi:hypothetical protein
MNMMNTTPTTDRTGTLCRNRRAPASARTIGGFPSNDPIREHLRAHGISGRITNKFCQEVVWDMFGVSIAKALEETRLFPPGAEGVQSFIDTLLSIGSPEAAKVLPQDAPVRIVTLRAFEILDDRLDGATKH